jgi:hypothetical protein
MLFLANTVCRYPEKRRHTPAKKDRSVTPDPQRAHAGTRDIDASAPAKKTFRRTRDTKRTNS